MKQSLRTTLLIASALLMIFGAVQFAVIIMPDLHGRLLEIGVQPTALGEVELHLFFVGIALFGFALMVSGAAIQTIRGKISAQIPFGLVALIYIVFGFIALLRSHNLHHFGPIVTGALLAAALLIPHSRGPGATIADRAGSEME